MNDKCKMDPEKRRRLEAAGWRVGDIDEFLGLSEEELEMVKKQVESGDQAS